MTPWYVRAILVRPDVVLANLERLRAAGVTELPTPWQLCLGVLRLWHRVIFRTETVGSCPDGRVRRSWRARLLEKKAIRLPFLLAERAVAPLDFTGLGSTPERVIRHLLGAHHDANQFVYDLELLAHHGRLGELHAAVRAVVAHDTARSRWLRDLTVFEGYHESLLAAVERALAEGPAMSAEEARDPDISFGAYLRWCARQPETPAATLRAWREGRFSFDSPLEAA
jgi:hypothetical protein